MLWYAAARDLACPGYGHTEPYKTLDELGERFTPTAERRKIGVRPRARVLAEHTAAHRAAELESYTLELLRA